MFGGIIAFEICSYSGQYIEMSNLEISKGIYLLIIGVACFAISFMLTILIGLHTYLIFNALTSWEYFSWMKITYMKVWPKKYGSPFRNKTRYLDFMYYFKPSNGAHAHTWRMPRTLPAL